MSPPGRGARCPANAAGPCVPPSTTSTTSPPPNWPPVMNGPSSEPYAHLSRLAVRRQLRARWGLDPAVIPNGGAYERFATADPAARAAWRARLGPYVLTVGGFEPGKGSLDLIEVYALPRAARPDARLVIAGGETRFDYRD